MARAKIERKNRDPQTEEIDRLLIEAQGAEVPAYKIAEIALQFCARIHTLRHKKHRNIVNRTERRADGTVVSIYRLVSDPQTPAQPATPTTPTPHPAHADTPSLFPGALPQTWIDPEEGWRT